MLKKIYVILNGEWYTEIISLIEYTYTKWTKQATKGDTKEPNKSTERNKEIVEFFVVTKQHSKIETITVMPSHQKFQIHVKCKQHSAAFECFWFDALYIWIETIFQILYDNLSNSNRSSFFVWLNSRLQCDCPQLLLVVWYTYMLQLLLPISGERLIGPFEFCIRMMIVLMMLLNSEFHNNNKKNTFNTTLNAQY